MTPARNVMEEMCPSPVARKLRMKRKAPAGKPVWSGSGTMEGLNRAADSNEYSARKPGGNPGQRKPGGKPGTEETRDRETRDSIHVYQETRDRETRDSIHV